MIELSPQTTKQQPANPYRFVGALGFWSGVGVALLLLRNDKQA